MSEVAKTKQMCKGVDARPVCAVCGVEGAKFSCIPCGTRYCSKACQKTDWKEHGHKKACKTLRAEREALTRGAPPPESPADRDEAGDEPLVFYGPEPRSYADDVRDRIRADHDAAQARREAEPEPEGPRDVWCDASRCPVCLEDWHVNIKPTLMSCCLKRVCTPCMRKHHVDNREDRCPLCRTPNCKDDAEQVARLQRGVDLGNAMAMVQLAQAKSGGHLGLTASKKSTAEAVELLKRATELGSGLAAFCLTALMKCDVQQYEHYLLIAAQRGCAEAQFAAAGLYHHGTLVAKDEEAEFKWMKAAADQGHVGGCYQFGQMLAEGRGCSGKYDSEQERLEEATRYFGVATRSLEAMADIDPKKDLVETSSRTVKTAKKGKKSRVRAKRGTRH